MTAAFVVTGRIIAERYGENITHTTPLESWSMGKSVSAGGKALRKAVAILMEVVPGVDNSNPGPGK